MRELSFHLAFKVDHNYEGAIFSFNSQDKQSFDLRGTECLLAAIYFDLRWVSATYATYVLGDILTAVSTINWQQKRQII